MKRCNICQTDKELNEFHKNKLGADGYYSKCKECKKLYREANKTRSIESVRQWRKNNKGCNTKYSKAYRAANPNYNAWQCSKRRKAAKRATLEGYDDQIKQIYLNCPEGHHVDHIIPLNNNEVCGLHVPWNLQYLTAEDNLKKSNKIPS